MYIVDTRTYSSTFPLSSNFEQTVPQSARCGVENREVPLKLELGHVGGWRPAGRAEGHELRFLVGPPWLMMGGWLGDNWGMRVMALGTFLGLGQASRSWAWA